MKAAAAGAIERALVPDHAAEQPAVVGVPRSLLP
jgi:hypothetical protein